MGPRIFFNILVVFLVLCCREVYANVSLTPFRASPDQVLVLYNADWEIDADNTEPGQDSREVADYYVKMHTDPLTGKKPYVLGLSCRHGQKHLNNWVIREDSQDNRNGIVFIGKGKGPGVKEWARDSRKGEIVLTPGPEGIDWHSVEIWCRPAGGKGKSLITPVVSGIPKREGRQFIYPEIDEGKGRCYRFDAHQKYSGTVLVSVRARDMSGKLVRDFTITYYDRDDFRFSLFGADGIVDEKNLQEDVIIPVKEFLDDPRNKLPDGTWLKDHILYIVIVHGMPFSCEAVLGIDRGGTTYEGNYGDLASLEQRMQTLYYGWEKMRPPLITMYMDKGPDAEKGVRNHRITSALRIPLIGPNWNPHMHPDTYSFLGKKKEVRFLDLPPFPEARKKVSPNLFSYAASRLDGQGADVAKRQIDYSLYASKFLRPEMDRLVRDQRKKEEKKMGGAYALKLEAAVRMRKWGKDELEFLGFRVLPRTKRQGMPVLSRPLEDTDVPSLNLQYNQEVKYAGFYPGGMERTVFSGNGWNLRKTASIWRQVDQGVSISACGGPASHGGPHITNATFWDNRILLSYLFRGRDLGECFLLSTYYVNWATSLLGDPLFHPDLSKTSIDAIPPKVHKDHIKIVLTQAMGRLAGTMEVPVVHTKNEPEVARLYVRYQRDGTDDIQVSLDPIYSVRPRVTLRDLEPDTTYLYQPVLVDPYGNQTDLAEVFGKLSFETGKIKPEKGLFETAAKKSKGFEIHIPERHQLNEKGTIQIEFIAGERGLLPNITSKDLRLKSHKWRKDKITIFMSTGAPEQAWKLKSPMKKGEKGVLELRWRRMPLTRELVLKAKNGTEFVVLADVRTPWQEPAFGDRVLVTEHDQVKILSASIRDDALPASAGACGIVVPPIDEKAWSLSNQ